MVEDAAWLVIFGFILSFMLAFGIGANDVSLSSGLTVGSGALRLRHVMLIANAFEILGAISFGYKVSDTLRRFVVKVQAYEGSEEELMCGCVSAMAASSLWMMIASCCRVPVSAAHSIVASIVGFSVVARGSAAIDWMTVGGIVLSWFMAPILSGLCSVLLFMLIHKLIVKSKDRWQAALRSMPFFWGLPLFLCLACVLVDNWGSPIRTIPLWMAWVFSIIVGLAAGFTAQFVLKCSQFSEANEENRTADIDFPRVDRTEKLFSYLQIMSTGFSSFTHGANDVSKAVGLLVIIYTIYDTDSVHQDRQCPFTLLFYGSIGISVGISAIGSQLSYAISKKLRHLKSSSCFVIQTSSALVILLASILGLPVSVMQCEVGSVVAIGYLIAVLQRGEVVVVSSAENESKSKKRVTWEDTELSENLKPFFSLESGVKWKLFRYILLGWGLTIPVTLGISALLMFCVRLLLGIH